MQIGASEPWWSYHKTTHGIKERSCMVRVVWRGLRCRAGLNSYLLIVLQQAGLSCSHTMNGYSLTMSTQSKNCISQFNTIKIKIEMKMLTLSIFFSDIWQMIWKTWCQLGFKLELGTKMTKINGKWKHCLVAWNIIAFQII